jgi:hypothetical protein
MNYLALGRLRKRTPGRRWWDSKRWIGGHTHLASRAAPGSVPGAAQRLGRAVGQSPPLRLRIGPPAQVVTTLWNSRRPSTSGAARAPGQSGGGFDDGGQFHRPPRQSTKTALVVAARSTAPFSPTPGSRRARGVGSLFSLDVYQTAGAALGAPVKSISRWAERSSGSAADPPAGTSTCGRT